MSNALRFVVAVLFCALCLSAQTAASDAGLVPDSDEADVLASNVSQADPSLSWNEHHRTCLGVIFFASQPDNTMVTDIEHFVNECRLKGVLDCSVPVEQLVVQGREAVKEITRSAADAKARAEAKFLEQIRLDRHHV